MKKKSFINNLRVENPCTENWNEMSGSSEVRFCSHCSKSVNNLSAMTRKQAIKLVRQSDGRLCIRYASDSETGGPAFAKRPVQISRRVPLIAAGVMTASLGLSTISMAQNGTQTKPAPATPVAEKVVRQTDTVRSSDPAAAVKDSLVKPSDADVLGSVTGTIYDQQGAVIPGASVVLRDENGRAVALTITNENGEYRIDNIQDGKFKIVSASPGFDQKSSELNISEAKAEVQNITLDVQLTMFTMGVVAYSPEYKGELAKAVMEDDVNAARDLIARGDNVNTKEEDGTTPLFIAVENGNIEMVRLLLDFGAKVNVRNKEKQTPLMMLDDDATKELVELLIQSGAKVNQKAKDGNTALISAAASAKADVLRALIDAGAEVDAADSEGVTALMNAAENGDIEAVRVLLLAGADPNLEDDEGDNAWYYADDKEIEDLLVSFGAKVETKIEDDIPPEPAIEP